MTSEVQLVQQDLKRNLNINVKITKLDYTTYYGRYVESKWDGMSWGFQSGHAVGLDERTYMYMHSRSTKNFFRVNDPVIDELTTKLRRTPDKAEQRLIAKKIVDREYDQVLRMWMPYDNGFLVFQPHTRNMAAVAMRRTDGYGSPSLARAWKEKQRSAPGGPVQVRPPAASAGRPPAVALVADRVRAGAGDSGR